ncbi:MAG: hypothetical protein ACRC8S_03720 [Fimbriiglobus sp.]
MSMRPFSRTSIEDHRPSLLKYRVVLHRVAGQGLWFVVNVLRDSTRFGEAEAMLRMWQALHTGQADVLETHLERAELFVEQMSARGLSVSLEPA